jgi:hypothetical protein
MLNSLTLSLQSLLNRKQQLLVLKIASRQQGEAHLALIAWSLGFINLQEFDALFHTAFELPRFYSPRSAQMTARRCPCCFDHLLRHIRQSGIYWFCCHCHEEMPGLEL